MKNLSHGLEILGTEKEAVHFQLVLNIHCIVMVEY